MSSYKKLSKADVTNVPYAANKQWNLSYSCPSVSNGYFNIYKGTYITGTFALNNYATDPFTNDQYERLVYSSINHLFYQSYSGSKLNTGSLMFNVDTYTSASQQRPTGAYFDYNTNPLLIKTFPTGTDASIRVLAVNQDIYGSKILPNSFRLSSSVYDIKDDGNGNLKNTIDCINYTATKRSTFLSQDSVSYTDCSGVAQSFTVENPPSTYPGSVTFFARSGSVIYNDSQIELVENYNSNNDNHIGNVFYAHGLAIITNPDYQNMFPVPPIAVNNLATFLTSDSSVKTINILQNDISRSCALDTGSVVLSGSNSQYYTVNSNGTITLNYSSSGNYDVYYTVNSKCGNGCSLTSNKAKVTVNVAQVNPPACITVEFYGGKPDQNFYYVSCGSSTTSSLTLNDTDYPVQKCIDADFGVSGSTNYNVIGDCSPISTPTGCSLYLLCGADRRPETIFYYTTCSGAPVTESIGTIGAGCEYDGNYRCISGSVTVDPSTPWGSYSLINLHCS